MKAKITIKENNKVVGVIEKEVRDIEHLRAQIKNPHKIEVSKKKYNRKKFKKGIDNY